MNPEQQRQQYEAFQQSLMREHQQAMIREQIIKREQESVMTPSQKQFVPEFPIYQIEKQVQKEKCQCLNNFCETLCQSQEFHLTLLLILIIVTIIQIVLAATGYFEK
ncbi:Hypothetical_protein [Hexamita inflata]|uniref:Hypothetical_protein n=1 Tax=Hexamita inflata TaxID=28002 RepID=A0AA86NG97_9EUKA|nr:Hypothetical protein HINF_LOCUS6188 [Hexamita inflata]